MVESVLAITILLIVISLLVYFYFREVKHMDQGEGLFSRIENIVNSRDNLLKDILEKKDLVHLKHIQVLEKQIQPKPVDKITDYVVSGAVSEKPNDIEKTDEDLKEDAFNEALKNVPITKDTKVVIEGDQLPEEII